MKYSGFKVRDLEEHFSPDIHIVSMIVPKYQYYCKNISITEACDQI